MNTTTITIRTATPADAPALLAIYAPYITDTAVSFEYDVPSVEEFANRIRGTLKKYPYLVAEVDGQIVGYCYVGILHGRQAYDWSVETSIYIDQNCKRMGIGRKLHDALEQALSAMGILNLYACIAFPIGKDPYLTEDSVHFHEHLGYTHTAHFHKCGYKFNRWYDIVWMEKTIGEHKEKQPEVKAFSEIEEALNL